MLFLAMQHIEDLTQEKFSLQRALEASRALAESLAAENSSMTESYNQQVGFWIYDYRGIMPCFWQLVKFLCGSIISAIVANLCSMFCSLFCIHIIKTRYMCYLIWIMILPDGKMKQWHSLFIFLLLDVAHCDFRFQSFYLFLRKRFSKFLFISELC